VGLLRASVEAYPENITIYVTSDNLLAVKALELCSSPLSREVKKVLASSYPRLAHGDGLHEVLLGRTIGAFRSQRELLFGVFNGYLVKAHVFDGAVMADWYEYADLVAYRGLNATWSSRLKEAELAWSNLTRMWDGYGFKDKAFDGRYESYKLALAYLLAKNLKVEDPIAKSLEEVMSKLQADNGGIYTHYVAVDGKIVPAGDVNVETTSIFIIACLSTKH